MEKLKDDYVYINEDKWKTSIDKQRWFYKHIYVSVLIIRSFFYNNKIYSFFLIQFQE